MNKDFIVRLIREAVFVGFFVFVVLNFVTTTKLEDRILVIVVELVFITTRIYCKVNEKGIGKRFGKRFDKKGDKNNDRH